MKCKQSARGRVDHHHMFGCVNSGMAAAGWEHHEVRPRSPELCQQPVSPPGSSRDSGSVPELWLSPAAEGWPARKWNLMPCSMSDQPSADARTNVLQGGHCTRNHLPTAQKQLVQPALVHQQNQTLGCNRRTINKFWVSPSHTNWWLPVYCCTFLTGEPIRFWELFPYTSCGQWLLLTRAFCKSSIRTELHPKDAVLFHPTEYPPEHPNNGRNENNAVIYNNAVWF